MRQRPSLTPIIGALPTTVPFVGPEAQERERGRPFRARIGANESSFGPSPRVIARMEAIARDMWMYCDPDNFDLKVAAAAHLGVGVDNVVVGEGIDGLLGLVARMYVGAGDAVVTSLGAYPTFNFHIAGVGGRLVPVPYANDKEDLDALLAAVRREKAPLVYFSNPDNPMGSWWEAPEILRFIEALPETTMLVLDEAYGELGPTSALPPIDVSRANVIRMRTFSKAYGLAGIRCGYAVAEREVIRDFEKIRNHYGVSRMAQIAGVEALADQEYLQSVVARVAAGRQRIASIAEQNGLKPLPSATNFVTIDCGSDGAFALRVMQALLSRDVFIRKPMVPILDRCIRVSVGLDHELDIFAEELPGALAAARGS
ncbi:MULTISPECIES: pyridoxal phosphate-dependent aminotransferase [unclassified Mesorhizobium]|uniref:pyridoxal phosphate-dependent aminotransferase n=1 Tax=unclassified Mesorhizobium TaxID=325217 RepID=UPI000BAF968E|nr:MULTISPECIES: pyridoxal phosphate-dependent aminotransferase [unclassified Mesorhizobium]PBB87566.1 histidinol-phosphate aminotransferase [Mesorhizobium sp. WSM3876]RWB74391.1 MAG: pyridoxal phosphate-dependent aminotransferase [Mesorhizobium sp.]RWB88266.1 MAG: pyridoxal phosphate-dependent aminotransferase [Mesorhizobium sp.]RWE27682.1 MAG: pyridoxal phosphate-dependent aminotransferase [Mesorhizobium sp.]TGS71924.1 pyridoxal phosphate-dependent aminotransferase [Mesorhizobium sp. M3A.F.C